MARTEKRFDRRRRSPQAGIPDYNAVVTLERVGSIEPAGV